MTFLLPSLQWHDCSTCHRINHFNAASSIRSFLDFGFPCLLLLSSLLSETNFLLARVHLALRLVGVYNFDLHPPTSLNPHHNLYCYHPHVRPLDDQQTHLGISTTIKTPHKKHSFCFLQKEPEPAYTLPPLVCYKTHQNRILHHVLIIPFDSLAYKKKPSKHKACLFLGADLK